MPAIRDYSATYESNTADSGITIPICDYAAGDLLLVFAMADTGAQTWGCTGYTQLFTTANTISTVCFWKIATASESDPVITGTVVETFNGCVISIRDVHQTTPFGSPAVYNSVAQTASTRYANAQITTTANDALLIYFGANVSTSGGLHIVENTAHELLIMDGTAESMTVGWAYKKTAGLSPADIYTCVPTSGNGVRSVLQVIPPAAGATIIPPYTVSDASTYLEHNSAIAAFDGNVAMTATADTNFGTTVATKTCNDASVAAATDIGVNSYHGMAGLTNAASATAMSGANVGLAATRYNIGTRNVLAHFRHPTPANNQRLSTVKSGRGVWMGMKSGATAGTNYKVWQVHAGDVPIIAGNIQPIIVNDGNADTIGTAGTFSNSDVRFIGFWTSGQGLLTQQTCIGPMWAMSTQVIAGGTSSEPITIPDIVMVCSTYKERVSSVLQGTNQMLCLQAIQFGDGGTNPVKLKLDSTAIEFPSKRNVAKKAINYNGIDDSVGFTYYAGSTDQIVHKSSIISSANKYHWRIHESSSTSATYNFTGLTLIGAGDVRLKSGITFDRMAFSLCPTVYQNAGTMTNCTFTDSTLYVNQSADLTNVSSSTFTKTTGTSHAIVINNISSNVTLTNVTFSGYAASNGSTGNEAIWVARDTGSVTINIVGGTTPSIRTSGATVTVLNTKNFVVNNIVDGTEVRIIRQSDLTELAGIENLGASSSGLNNVTAAADPDNAGRYKITYSYGYTSDVPIYVAVFKENYGALYLSSTLKSTDSTLTAFQITDRQYV